MNNPLYDELLNLRYIPINEIDEELPPESVVLYFKNLSQLDKRISVEPIHGVQIDLQNQNPTIELEDYKATFCLGPSPYIPVVTIDPIEDFIDPRYPLSVTFTGTVSRSDNYIPNEIVVNYNNVNKRATLTNDTQWTVTFDLRQVDQNLTDYVSAKANSIDVNSSVISGYSEIVTNEFNIIFLEVECTPSVAEVSCLCLDTDKSYQVTVNGETTTGSFDNIVSFLDEKGLYAYPGGVNCNPCYNLYRTIETFYEVAQPPMEMFSVEASTSRAMPTAEAYSIFTVSEEGLDDIEIKVPDYYLGYNLFNALLENTPNISTSTSNSNYMFRSSFKNTLEVDRQITYHSDDKRAIASLNPIYINHEPDPLVIKNNTFSFCMAKAAPVRCDSSTSSLANYQEFPDLGSLSNLSFSCNGINYTLDQIFNGEAPFRIEPDFYGVKFINTLEDCILIEMSFENEGLYIPYSETFGAESEVVGNVFRLSLAGQVFTPVTVRSEFLDSNGYSVNGLLDEGKTYTVQMQAYGDNPHPDWKGIVTYLGNEYTLFVGYANAITFDVTIPSNSTWNTYHYTYDFDMTAELGFEYENGARPSFDVSVMRVYNAPAEVKYSYYTESVTSTNGSYFELKEKHYSKRELLTIQLPAVYAGLIVKEPFNSVVSESGLLVIDLSKSYPYNSGWTTDNHISQSFTLWSEEGTRATSFYYYVGLDTCYTDVERSDYPGQYTTSYTITRRVGQEPTLIRLGPLPGVTKVSLSAHQGASLFPNSNVILEVNPTDNYVYYKQPTPTEVYSPYVNDPNWPLGSYRVTTILIGILEGDPKYIGMMKQSSDLKYEVTA